MNQTMLKKCKANSIISSAKRCPIHGDRLVKPRLRYARWSCLTCEYNYNEKEKRDNGKTIQD